MDIKTENLSFPCKFCDHKNVCKKINEKREEDCKNFIESPNYKNYSDINRFFEPIFEWMSYHYPSEGIVFIVNKDIAQMHLPYGASVVSKRLMNCCCCAPLDEKQEDK